MIDNDTVSWRRAARNPVALVILPWEQGGVTIAHRDSDGTLHGCRDVSNIDDGKFAACVAAWISDERSRGRAIDDRAGAADMVRRYAAHLVTLVEPGQKGA